jgi:hypothetical protein
MKLKTMKNIFAIIMAITAIFNVTGCGREPRGYDSTTTAPTAIKPQSNAEKPVSRMAPIFGQDLGEVVTIPAGMVTGTNMLGIACSFMPKSPHKFFTKYVAAITPTTHKLYEIEATGPFEEESVNEIRRDMLVKNVQDKYKFKCRDYETDPETRTLESADEQYSISLKVTGQGYGSQLRLTCVCVPLLNQSVDESAAIRDRAIDNAAKSGPSL